MSSTSDSDTSDLKRSVGLVGLTFYGTGTILGAGIFVVIGEVVGEAGTLAPLSYVLAGLVAVFTALSFAEMGARVPTAAGAIDYVEKAFERRWLGNLAGWLLTVANIVSGATITTGFVSYLSSFADVPSWMATVGLVGLLGAIAIIGMKQSAVFMTITTLIGIGALLLILWLSRESLMAAPGKIMDDLGSFDGSAMSGLFVGGFLAIYSFIGFGDMAQTAEETKNVQKTLPRAIIFAMIIVFTFYLLIAASLVGQDNMEEIANAKAPLVKAIEGKGFPTLPIAIASLFVIVNGGLTQVIAGSRLLLDLGRDGRWAPGIFGRVNESTHTPIVATLVVIGIVLALALFVPLKNLASATSFTILLVFTGVNGALFRLKAKEQPDGVPNIPRFVPLLGIVFCLIAMAGQIWLWISGG